MAFYRCMGGNGGGTTPTSITPSNSSPAAMSSGGVYQPTANGYAIESYQDKTPSDSTPPTVASGDIVKMGGAGYLYATQQGLDPANMSQVNSGGSAVSSSGYSTTIDNGRYLVTSIRTGNPTSGIHVEYVENFVVSSIYQTGSGYVASSTVEGTTLKVTRNNASVATAPTVYITKLS